MIRATLVDALLAKYKGQMLEAQAKRCSQTTREQEAEILNSLTNIQIIHYFILPR